MFRMKALKYPPCWLIWTGVVLLAACGEVRPYRLEPGELFPDGKPLGQPYSSVRSDVRMVRVSSADEADSFCMALRDRHPECRVSYTRGTPAGTYEVGIVRIMDSTVIARGIREIRFVGTVRPKGE